MKLFQWKMAIAVERQEGGLKRKSGCLQRQVGDEGIGG
jgi:hypothetical protein